MDSLVRLCAVFFVLVLLFGCGSKSAVPDRGSPEGQEIAKKMDGLVEDKGRPEKYKFYFVKGAEPANAAAVKKFASMDYDLLGPPSVSGGTATATVQVRKADAGESLGKVEWTFVKEGSGWLIKSAPLP